MAIGAGRELMLVCPTQQQGDQPFPLQQARPSQSAVKSLTSLFGLSGNHRRKG